jgi:hypothetical protein
MPAHEVYQVLVDIWSGGCNPQLHYALPILFAFEISGTILSALGVHRRAHYAVLKEEAEQHAFKSRVDTAMMIIRQTEEKDRKEFSAKGSDEIYRADEKKADVGHKLDDAEETEEHEREDLTKTIKDVNTKIERLQTRTERSLQFGPAFGFNFGCDESQKGS